MKLTDQIFKEMNNTTYFREHISLFANIYVNSSKFSSTTDIFIDDIECTTGDALIDMGIGVCNHCGKLLSVDDYKCSSCLDERFIVRHSARRKWSKISSKK